MSLLTIRNLTVRFATSTGSFTAVDGIDVRDMTLSELRRRIGYIPQQGRLFSGTVESNLKFAGDMVSDEDMRQAARVAQAEDFIAEREGGYDSPISQSGLLFYNTLFDENAACHLALGKAYPTCIRGGEDMDSVTLAQHGVNDSLLHEDFMIGTRDLAIVGTTKDGQQVQVFKNGNFAF